MRIRKCIIWKNRKLKPIWKLLFIFHSPNTIYTSLPIHFSHFFTTWWIKKASFHIHWWLAQCSIFVHFLSLSLAVIYTLPVLNAIQHWWEEINSFFMLSSTYIFRFFPTAQQFRSNLTHSSWLKNRSRGRKWRRCFSGEKRCNAQVSFYIFWLWGKAP